MSITVNETGKIVLRVATRPVTPTGAAPQYTHMQSAESAVWTVNHNLGYRPTVSIFNASGQPVLAEVLNVSVNQLQILFVTPISGTARCH